MDQLRTFITNHWQRKLVALLSAIVIWYFVSDSLTDTKMIPHVGIRVANIPEDKTIPGLQPNGLIAKRINLTLKGTRDVIRALEPSDLEVVIDASEVQQNDWVVYITKKNLVSLNPSIDLSRHISEVEHPEFVLKFSNLMSAKIPITVKPPTGYAPPGYSYLDYWPQTLYQRVEGPQEQVQELLRTGLELELDMNMISKADLDKIKSDKESINDDEISFVIPAHWKKVHLPFKGGRSEEINDPEAQYLRIDFLRREYLPLPRNVNIRVFYPLQTANTLNPETAPLLPEGKIKKIHSVYFLAMPLYAYNVSHLFLEIIKDNLEINIIADNPDDGSSLQWNIDIVDSQLLETKYINILSTSSLKTNEPRQQREEHLRQRFREYVRNLTLYSAPDKKLQLDVRMSKTGISVIPSAL